MKTKGARVVTVRAGECLRVDYDEDTHEFTIHNADTSEELTFFAKEVGDLVAAFHLMV